MQMQSCGALWDILYGSSPLSYLTVDKRGQIDLFQHHAGRVAGGWTPVGSKTTDSKLDVVGLVYLTAPVMIDGEGQFRSCQEDVAAHVRRFAPSERQPYQFMSGGEMDAAQDITDSDVLIKPDKMALFLFDQEEPSGLMQDIITRQPRDLAEIQDKELHGWKFAAEKYGRTESFVVYPTPYGKTEIIEDPSKQEEVLELRSSVGRKVLEVFPQASSTFCEMLFVGLVTRVSVSHNYFSAQSEYGTPLVGIQAPAWLMRIRKVNVDIRDSLAGVARSASPNARNKRVRVDQLLGRVQSRKGMNELVNTTTAKAAMEVTDFTVPTQGMEQKYVEAEIPAEGLQPKQQKAVEAEPSVEGLQPKQQKVVKDGEPASIPMKSYLVQKRTAQTNKSEGSSTTFNQTRVNSKTQVGSTGSLNRKQSAAGSDKTQTKSTPPEDPSSKEEKVCKNGLGKGLNKKNTK